MKTKSRIWKSRSSISTANLSKIKKSRRRKISKRRAPSRILATTESMAKLKTCTCLAAQTPSLKMRIATIWFSMTIKTTKVKSRTMMKTSKSTLWDNKIRSKMNKCNKTSTSKWARLPSRWSLTKHRRLACLTWTLLSHRPNAKSSWTKPKLKSSAGRKKTPTYTRLVQRSIKTVLTRAIGHLKKTNYSQKQWRGSIVRTGRRSLSASRRAQTSNASTAGKRSSILLLSKVHGALKKIS